MGLIDRPASRYRKPEGSLGRLIGRSMNYGHRRPGGWALDIVSTEEEDIILDVGCGGGRSVHVMARKARRGKVYGLDYSEDMVGLSGRVNRGLVSTGNVGIPQGSVSPLPFEDGKSDLVTAFDSCYFRPYMREDLKEIRRLFPGRDTCISGRGGATLPSRYSSSVRRIS